MSALTVNTDAYSRLKVPGANAARLVDEWADSCASSQDEFESKALLIAVDGFEGPTLTTNERGWLEEYVRQLQERFPTGWSRMSSCWSRMSSCAVPTMTRSCEY